MGQHGNYCFTSISVTYKVIIIFRVNKKKTLTNNGTLQFSRQISFKGNRNSVNKIWSGCNSEEIFTNTAAILNLFDLRSIIGCQGGMSTFRLYFRAVFGTFFVKVFLEKDCNGKKDLCAVFGCNNDHLFLV